METNTMRYKRTLPLSEKNLVRLLVVVVIVLAIAAGYYKTQYRTVQKQLMHYTTQNGAQSGK